MRNKKLVKKLAFVLSFCIAVSSFPQVLAEENEPLPPMPPAVEDDVIQVPEGSPEEVPEISDELSPDEFYDESDLEINEQENLEIEQEEKTEETEEKVELNDKDAVRADTLSLDIGFLRCVSRDLVLPTKGENGSTITWKSSNPKVITNDGKYIKPQKVTDVVLTATISKGIHQEKKSFKATVNRRSMYDVMMDYVDTMIEYGRDDHYFTPEEYANANRVEKMTDTVGTNVKHVKSGLFFSIMERDTLKYPAYYVEDWPRITYNSDERASGCETSPEIYVYEMLYDITAMTGDESYAKVADDNLSFFLANCRHPSSGVLAWGLHTIYDPVIGGINSPNQYATSAKEQSAWHDYNEPGYGDRYLFRNPFFIEKFFDLDYEATEQHMLSWYSATLANKKDFSFSRHTRVSGASKASGNYASMMNPMGFAYMWGNIFSGDPQFKEALNSMMNWVERISAMNEHYMFAQELYITNNRFHSSWMRDCMAMAVWFREMAPLVPDDIAERMIRYTDFIIDECMGYNPNRSNSDKFYSDYDLGTGLMASYRDPTSLTAYPEMWFVLQAEGDERADKFEEWLIDWTEKHGFNPIENYLDQTDYFPRTIANEINHHLNMYRGTGDEKYLDRALEISDFAIYDFWELESLLPSMTHAQKRYYESNWGSTQVVKAVWDAYFYDVERKTGVHPVEDAWEKAGNTTKSILDLRKEEHYTKFMEKNKSDLSVLR